MAPKTITLDEIVTTWAFLKIRGNNEKDLKQEDVTVEVNWSNVRLMVVPSSLSYWDQKCFDLSEPIRFISTSDNPTNTAVEFSPRKTYSTQAICTTTITKGFTTMTPWQLKLRVPEEVTNMTTVFGQELILNGKQTQTCFSTMDWETNNKKVIMVKPKHRLVFETLLDQRDFEAQFKATIEMKGPVSVTVNNQGVNSFVLTIENEINDILKTAADTLDSDIAINNKAVTWELQGQCRFLFPANERFEQEQVPL